MVEKKIELCSIIETLENYPTIIRNVLFHKLAKMSNQFTFCTEAQPTKSSHCPTNSIKTSTLLTSYLSSGSTISTALSYINMACLVCP